MKNSGFTTKTYVSGDPNNTLVVEQTPKPGSYLSKNSVIVLYGEDSNVSTSITVPDLKGMSASQAANVLKEKNLNINIEGSGTVISQEPNKDTQVQEGSIVRVTLKQNLTDAH